jgi:hypothetical protein
MAAELVTAAELSAWVGVTIPTPQADLFIAAATALVQAETGQTLTQVLNDTITLDGTSSEWLALPQRPVTAVHSVTMQDANLSPIVLDTSQYSVRGNRLWRPWGWQFSAVFLPPVRMLGYQYMTYPPPSQVTISLDHGRPAGDPGLELARMAVFTLGASVFANPSGSRSVTVDDYTETFADAYAGMQLPPGTRAALRRYYGHSVGSVKPQ